MDLLEHAEDELRRGGYFEPDSDYGPRLAECVLATLRAFSSYGHSGGSVEAARDLFVHLANYGTLAPITSDPAEWLDRSEMSGYPLWQNVRDSTAFSEDGGKTWWTLAQKDAEARAEEERKLAELDPLCVMRAARALFDNRQGDDLGAAQVCAPRDLWDALGAVLGRTAA